MMSHSLPPLPPLFSLLIVAHIYGLVWNFPFRKSDSLKASYNTVMLPGLTDHWMLMEFVNTWDPWQWALFCCHKFCRVQFSSVPWLVGWSGEHEGWFSRHLLPVVFGRRLLWAVLFTLWKEGGKPAGHNQTWVIIIISPCHPKGCL